MSEEAMPDESAGSGPKFDPIDMSATQVSDIVRTENESWFPVLQCRCTYPSEIFESVMSNLISNPNLTSSHLFRADILFETTVDRPRDSRHLKPEYRPIETKWTGFVVEKTTVRQLIPRNPQLDQALVQTCHFLRLEHNEQEMRHDYDEEEEEQHNLVIYIPHVDTADQVPFYHPCVKQLAFLHKWRPSSTAEALGAGSITILYHPFPESPLTTKLSRTALRLLETIFKHGQGRLAGYTKRVHHDQVIPQKRYQDTYTMLKAKYGKQLSQQWVEVTDPGKHVFEDLGIAAFLIELWRDMYHTEWPMSDASDTSIEEPAFPGFVDIGCGNGVLVHILVSEGYPGWGFDARKRKTWSIFPPETQQRLQQRILVPHVLSQDGGEDGCVPETWHSGIFGGEFIVSNHADELTAWTPLLAFLNNTSFIAIPCCSHDLSGARSRLPETMRSPKRPYTDTSGLEGQGPNRRNVCRSGEANKGQAAETGSLKRSEAEKRMPSAYSTLCSYVVSLAEGMEFETEREVLRIPSTRNHCILGRRPQTRWQTSTIERAREVLRVIEGELRRDIQSVRSEWVKRANKLMQKPMSGH